MKRRALIAQALVTLTPVIVLDEPTAGVDVELRQRLWAFIKELNKEGHTIILTTHYLEEAETLCNRVGMMRSGKLVALDTTKNLLKKFAAKNLKLRLNLDKKNGSPLSLAGTQYSLSDDWFTFELKKISDVASIIDKLKQKNIEILDMETVDPDLENVFLKLTRKKV